MTQLSRDMDQLVNDIDLGKYQVQTNKHGKELLKIDLEDMFKDSIKNNNNQAEYIKNLELELENSNALLSKFEVK